MPVMESIKEEEEGMKNSENYVSDLANDRKFPPNSFLKMINLKS